MNIEKRPWPCNFLGHKLHGRYSIAESVSYSPGIKELLAREDLDTVIATARMLIMDNHEMRMTVTRLLSGAEVVEHSVYHGDVCVRCGLTKLPQVSVDSNTIPAGQP